MLVLADGHRNAAELHHDGQLGYAVQRVSGWKPARRLLKASRVKRLLKEKPVEGIFADTWKSAEYIAVAASLAGIRLVCLAHGNDVLAPSHRRLKRIRKVLDKAYRVAANSHATAQRVRALGTAEKRIVVVHPGVSPPQAPVSEGEQTAAIASPLLLTLGRLEARKGHDQVIHSLPGLLTKYPKLKYAIAGSGPDRGRLEKLTQDLELGERVLFLGAVTEGQKAAWLAAADLLVMPTRDDHRARSVEGFGMAFIEAAFLGLPAIAGNSGGVREAVVDGVTRWLCDGTDAPSVEATIMDCLSDPGRLRNAGATARERAERMFSWQAVIDRYLACLE